MDRHQARRAGRAAFPPASGQFRCTDRSTDVRENAHESTHHGTRRIAHTMKRRLPRGRCAVPDPLRKPPCALPVPVSRSSSLPRPLGLMAVRGIPIQLAHQIEDTPLLAARDEFLKSLRHCGLLCTLTAHLQSLLEKIRDRPDAAVSRHRRYSGLHQGTLWHR